MKIKQPSPEIDPLARKLGLKQGKTAWVIAAPKPYGEFFTEWPQAQLYSQLPTGIKADFIHLFATTYADLENGLEQTLPTLNKNGMLWISWPKKSSGIASEIDKFDVMRAGQAIGLVDVKVASIDEVWSGHKFVIPLAKR